MAYSFLINSVERVTDVLFQSVVIEDVINDQQNTLTFSLVDRSGNGIPNTDDEVRILMEDGTVIFGGYIVSVKESTVQSGVVRADITAVDYTWLLDRNLVHTGYEDMTDKEIFEVIVATYCAGFGITTNNIIEGVTINQKTFNYIQPSQAFRQIVELTGRNWYIDYDKDIHYFPLTENPAPFNLIDLVGYFRATVHIGSQSLDVHTNSQSAINEIVADIVASVPNVEYIAIGTYFDYDSTSGNDQFSKWATAIHNNGKKMWIRSAGFNDWTGQNSVAQYTSSDFAEHHRTKIKTWIDNNYSIFAAGDIMECVPDEPEGNSRWNAQYGTIGSGAGLTAFNAFIVGAKQDVDERLAAHGVLGVITGDIHTNPSCARDVITDETAAIMGMLGTDDYPGGASTDPATLEAAMEDELNEWVVGNKSTIPKNITFGPNVYAQMSEADQGNAITLIGQVIKDNIEVLHGITYWSFGAVDNGPLSRLFQYTGSAWSARSGTSNLNTLFEQDVPANTYYNLTISKDASQLKNRVYVRGGTKLSDATTYEEKGDGKKRKFTLPDKPHNVSVAVNGVTKTLGIKNVDLSGYDWYLNFQEKYLEQDAGGSVLGTGDTLTVNYQYDIPILVAVENTASIAENGVREFAIFDKAISTTQAARDRASAELTDYANDLIEGSFETYEPGFRSGQYMHIKLAAYDIDDDYLIQKVVSRSMGGGKFVYTVYIASAKTLGIIKFLIELLEANKNLIELDDNEVVDELYAITDSLISDSLVDALTIDSAGPYSTWCSDSLQSTPTTRARWNLFQWG